MGMGFNLIPDMLTFRLEGGLDLRSTFNDYPLGSAGFGLFYTIGNGTSNQPE